MSRLRLATLAAAAALLLGTAGAAADAPVLGRTVLALYKSSEGQTAADNEVAAFVEPALRSLGLGVRYHDVDSGLPEPGALEGARAVISWFRGPSMAAPERYLAFVRSVVDGGRKFVVLDNLGAYQERGSGRWLESGELNLTLARFGLQYWGDWTDDPGVVTIAAADPAIFRAKELAAAGLRLLYYRYQVADRDLEVLLSVERRDRATGPSPVAVANANGAFVLSSYLTAFREGKQEVYLDFAELLRRALFGRAGEDRVAILTDAASGDGAGVAVAERILAAARIRADLFGHAALGLLVPGDLARYTTVVLSLASAGAVDDAVIGDYLARGGSVVSLRDVLPPSLLKAAASAPAGPPPEPRAASGMRFGASFPTLEGFFLEDRDVPWRAGTLRPPAGATSLATDWLGETTLLWSLRTPAGGTVLVWNARELWKPEHAGLLLESVLASRPVAAAATPGLAAVRLDGFPRPLYDAAPRPGGVTDTAFYTTRFWPDLRDLLAKRAIPASASIVFTYNDRVSAPFWGGELYMADKQASVTLARALLASGAEVGLFGYNHLSLATTLTAPNTRAWPSRQSMEEALRVVREDWKLLFGEHTLPTSYAAPYGLLDDEGLAALLAAFPEVRAVGTGVTAAAGGPGGSGFTRVASRPAARLQPAASGGFAFTERTRRMLASAVLGEGVWVHALDADDPLDAGASGGRSWDEMKADLERLLVFQARHYPWLRFLRVSDLSAELDRLEGPPARLELRGTAGGVTSYLIEAAPGTTFRIRSPGLRVQSVEGGELLYAYARSDAAVLRASAGRMVVTLAKKG